MDATRVNDGQMLSSGACESINTSNSAPKTKSDYDVVLHVALEWVNKCMPTGVCRTRQFSEEHAADEDMKTYMVRAWLSIGAGAEIRAACNTCYAVCSESRQAKAGSSGLRYLRLTGTW